MTPNTVPTIIRMSSLSEKKTKKKQLRTRGKYWRPNPVSLPLQLKNEKKNAIHSKIPDAALVQLLMWTKNARVQQMYNIKPTTVPWPAEQFGTFNHSGGIQEDKREHGFSKECCARHRCNVSLINAQQTLVHTKCHMRKSGLFMEFITKGS